MYLNSNQDWKIFYYTPIQYQTSPVSLKTLKLLQHHLGSPDPGSSQNSSISFIKIGTKS